MMSKNDWFEKNYVKYIDSFVDSNTYEFEEFLREKGLHPDDDAPDAMWDFVECRWEDFKGFVGNKYYDEPR